MEKGEDFIVERDLPALVARMNALAGGEPLISVEEVEREIRARDMQLDNPFSKDMQVTALRIYPVKSLAGVEVDSAAVEPVRN